MTVYKNLDGTTPDKGLSDILKWKLGPKRGDRDRRGPFTTPRRENDGAGLAASTPHLTWIGHATFVMRLGGKLIATDPVWGRVNGVVKRLAEPGVALDAVPPLDVVTVSHSHFDHLDLATLKRLGARSKDVLFVVPKDNASLLQGAGLPNVVELAWWASHTVGDLKITLVPAQHWSMRMPWDRNKRLWGGFVYEAPDGVAYHAGDTAFKEEVFARIGEKFGGAGGRRIDYAMIPIGAYDPAWFMSPQHIGPEDAGRAFDLLGARTFVAMHWGTFKLTDEPLGEPPERLRAWWASRSLPWDRLWIPDIGEARPL